MKNNLKNNWIFITAILVLISCKNNHRDNADLPPQECIELNRKGAELLMSYSPENPQNLDNAIQLFKQATICDSNFVSAYLNLANAYDRKRNYKDELLIYNKLSAITNNDPAILILKEIDFEKMNDTVSMKNNYYLARKEYEKRLTKNLNNIELIKGLIRLKAITYGKDSALLEIRNQIKTHPVLSSKLLDDCNFYQNFDRNTFIHGGTTKVSSWN